MEVARKASAIIMGVLMIVLLVLVARWTGEKIRERFFTPKPIITTREIPAVTSQTPVAPVEQPTATYSAIPKTGPTETGLVLLGLLFTTGLSSLALARKTS